MRPLVSLLRIASTTVLVAFTGCATARETTVTLFNGKNLTGWVQHGGKATYSVENGEIVGRATPNTPNSFLCTERSFTNFVLTLEFKPMTGLNSGIQFRSRVSEGTVADRSVWNGKTNSPPKGRVYGYQAEIDPSARAWTAGLYEEGRRGWLQDLTKNEPARKAYRANDWNTLRLEARGDHLQTWLNGVPATDLHDGALTAGFIGLQVHGVKTNTQPLEIRWRNLRLTELP